MIEKTFKLIFLEKLKSFEFRFYFAENLYETKRET